MQLKHTITSHNQNKDLKQFTKQISIKGKNKFMKILFIINARNPVCYK